MINIILFGPPGAGKGTQSNKLIEKYNLVHLSTGDILRSEISNKTKLGLEAKTFIDKGELVPDEVVIGMINTKIEANKFANGFIFDGFPRTLPQAIALDALLNQRNIPISGMIALVVEKEELIKRLLNRGKDSGRTDDQDIDIIENRIKVYNNETAPLAEYYDKQNKYKGINGIGTVDQIFDRVCSEIDKL